MLRRFARFLLFAAFAASLAVTGLNVVRIASQPELAALRDATIDEFAAASEAMLAAAATPELLHAHVANRLAEDPRNWLALDALIDLAAERKIGLPLSLTAAIEIAREDDHGYYSQITSCAQCAYDPAVCSLEQVMVCQAPVALTPIGDIAGIARAGVAYASGGEVDQIDLALSTVGLGATLAVVVSGGSSGVVKAGAGLAKLARKMGRLSPRLVEMAMTAARRGIDWVGLPSVRSMDELRAVVRSEEFAPLTATLLDLERLRVATDATTALHLLPMVDDAADARRLAIAAEALGPKLVGRAEVLGKARLFRASYRMSKAAWGLAAGWIALMVSLAGLIGHGLQSMAFAALRRMARG